MGKTRPNVDRRRAGVSRIAWTRSVVSLAAESTAALEDGARDIARRLSREFVDWFFPFATASQAAVGVEPLRCFSADRDLSHMDRDAAAHALVEGVAEFF